MTFDTNVCQFKWNMVITNQLFKAMKAYFSIIEISFQIS
jgi:hypothetical protein